MGDVDATRRAGNALRLTHGDRLAPVEFVAVLLRPSGAGKTTLFQCLTGLTRPDGGAVILNERDICRMGCGEVRAARRDVALIFQQCRADLREERRNGA